MASLEELEKRHQEWSAKGPLADLSEGFQIISDLCEYSMNKHGHVSHGDPMEELTRLMSELKESLKDTP